MLRNFALSLADPFNPDSLGCRVPDPFSAPTAVYHLRGTSILKTDGFGKAGVTCFPNPNFSMFDNRGFISATPLVSSSTMSTLNSSLYAYGATNPGVLDSILSSYRIVSWGIRVRNLLPELSGTGRVTFAPIIMGDTTPGYSSFDSTNEGGCAAIACGMLTPYMQQTNAILDLPEAVHCSIGDLFTQDVQLVGFYTNTNFFNFKSSMSAGPLASAYAGDAIQSNTLGAVVRNEYKDATRCNGGNAWIIYVDGAPINSNTLEIEYIYHLEGTPLISTITQGTTANPLPVTSVASESLPGKTDIVESAIRVVAGKRAMSSIRKVTSFLNSPGVKLAGKAAMAALASL